MILLLAVVGSAAAQAEVQATVSALNTHEAGQFAQTIPSDDPQDAGVQDGLGYQVELVPTGLLALEAKRQRFGIQYAPRIFYRVSESGSAQPTLSETLVLHEGRIDHVADLGKGWTLTDGVVASLGDTDFTSAFISQTTGGDTTPGGAGQDAEGANQPINAATAPFVRVINFGGNAGLAAVLDARNRLEFGLSADYVDTENRDVAGNEVGTGQQTFAFFATASYGRSLTRRDELSVELGFTSSEFSRVLVEDGDATSEYVRLLRTNLRWNRRLGRRWTSELSAGAQLAIQSPPLQLDPALPEPESDPEVYPFGGARLDLQLAPTGPVRWAATAGAIVDGTLDQNLARFVPSLLGQVGLQMETGLWSATLNAGFVGPLDVPVSVDGRPSDDPDVDETNPLLFPDNQTQLSSDLGIARAFPPSFRVFVQFRTFASGPHPGLPFFSFSSVQATGLLGLEVTWSTIPAAARRVERTQPDAS